MLEERIASIMRVLKEDRVVQGGAEKREIETFLAPRLHSVPNLDIQHT
jgi:hypothetical protein